MLVPRHDPLTASAAEYWMGTSFLGNVKFKFRVISVVDYITIIKVRSYIKLLI